MSARRKPAKPAKPAKPTDEESCPHCGCPEVHTWVRRTAQGDAYSVTSCPGCNSVNGEPPPLKPAPAKRGAR